MQMHIFWEHVIKPLFDKIKPKSVLEIGCFDGKSTIKLLKYCCENGAKLHAIDPFPQFDVNDLLDRYKNFRFSCDISLNVLEQTEKYDVVLLDGDHNWYTVWNELKLIEKNVNKDEEFPVVLIHDIGWPYARRDMYYNPELIPKEYLHPYEQMGIKLHQNRLDGTGLVNKDLYNALYEGGTKNGVLTAVEDFINESGIAFAFYKIPIFHGLGILIPNTKEKYLNLIDLIKDILFNGSLLRQIEEERLFLTEQILYKDVLISSINKRIDLIWGIVLNQDKIREWVINNNIQKVAIFGTREMGRFFFLKLTELGVSTVYFIDNYKSNDSMFNVPIIPQEKLRDIKNEIDSIILTIEGQHYKEVLESIQKMNLNINLFTIHDLLQQYKS